MRHNLLTIAPFAAAVLGSALIGPALVGPALVGPALVGPAFGQTTGQPAGQGAPPIAPASSWLANDVIGAAPTGWLLDVTGRGVSRWSVEADPNGSKVLRQSGAATYPLALLKSSSVANGFVETSFNAISGREDRAAGLVWRAKDNNNYYVVRANALEDNVVLYKTVNGNRTSLPLAGQKGGYGVSAPVPPGTWHTLRVEFAGERFSVIYNGKRLYDVVDKTFGGAGMVGLWTKADSETLFRNFTFGSLP